MKLNLLIVKKEKIMKRLICVMLMLLMAAPVAYAKDVGGANIPDTYTIEGNKLLLNGAGVRRKFGLVKVYVGALFLTKKDTNAAKIVAADEPMMIRMHSIRSGVSEQKLINSWNESFENITGGNTAPYQKEINMFNSAFDRESQENDKFDFVWIPGKGLTVYDNGKVKAEIPGLEFKKLVFSIWLGENPSDRGLAKLKDQMLGLRD